MMTRYYPNSMKRVYVYRPSLIFRGVFAIFGAWLSADTRNKFVLAARARARRHRLHSPGRVRRRRGAGGARRDAARRRPFLRRAIDLYDSVREARILKPGRAHIRKSHPPLLGWLEHTPKVVTQH